MIYKSVKLSEVSNAKFKEIQKKLRYKDFQDFVEQIIEEKYRAL